jgi:hypothetical protein
MAAGFSAYVTVYTMVTKDNDGMVIDSYGFEGICYG